MQCIDCIRPFLNIFFFNDTATTEIYTLSLHDALPISVLLSVKPGGVPPANFSRTITLSMTFGEPPNRSEEHTSELQSRSDLVCRLLLEKKKVMTISFFSHFAPIRLAFNLNTAPNRAVL